eukprot:CAMPEP_0185822724 /NCGR_PEP_ID=MMETSP1322-20130828/27128_1 /TAXON_ID=265543 /ORGANISM="Minutocellus polymorphus, Strain RCC2270" /LENGTH=81 /DNA_ID=CAMNT_0028520217 /DNA_START=45 /DNA_END=290 /DNA_ORIENTATION=+
MHRSLASLSRIDGFKRAIGLKGGFRRTGASSWHNIIVSSAVGCVSGYYIFAEPLRDYWEDQRQRPHTEMGSKIAAAGQNSK